MFLQGVLGILYYQISEEIRLCCKKSHCGCHKTGCHGFIKKHTISDCLFFNDLSSSFFCLYWPHSTKLIFCQGEAFRARKREREKEDRIFLFREGH